MNRFQNSVFKMKSLYALSPSPMFPSSDKSALKKDFLIVSQPSSAFSANRNEVNLKRTTHCSCSGNFV